MATIKELIYSVWAKLDGSTAITADSRFTYRQIKIEVKSAIAAAIRDEKYTTSNFEDSTKYGSDVYLQTYEGLPVLFDPVLKLKYLQLPCELIPIYDGRQVSIYPNSGFNYNSSALFLPITKQEQLINRFQSALPDASMFYVSGKSRVYFTNQGRVLDEIQLNALVRFAIPNDDDVEVGAPSGDISKITLNAYQSLMPEVKPTDQTIDGVPNP